MALVPRAPQPPRGAMWTSRPTHKTSAQAAKAFTHRSAEDATQGYVACHGLGLSCYGWKDTKGNITKTKSDRRNFQMPAGGTGIVPVAGRLEACATRFRRVDAPFGMMNRKVRRAHLAPGDSILLSALAAARRTVSSLSCRAAFKAGIAAAAPGPACLNV